LRCPECNVHPELDNGELLSDSSLEKNITPISRKQIKGGIIWTGGEPFETPDLLLHGLHLASSYGFFSEILTGGLWHRNADSMLKSLVPYRDFINIRISLDGPHLAMIGSEPILNLCTEIMKRGFRLSFTVRTGDPYSSPELAALKNDLAVLQGRLTPERIPTAHLWHQIPHMTAPAESPSSPKDSSGGISPSRKCRLAGKDRVIAWDGHLYACCGLFLFPDNYRLSLDFGSNREIFEQLRLLGPKEIARRLKIPLPNCSESSESTPCPLCQYLWKHHSTRLRTELFSAL